MSECIIARGGGSASGGQQIPIVPGYCSILVTVKDETDAPVANIATVYSDGENTYEYFTNERGQTLFTTNKGQCNIVARNYTNTKDFRYADIAFGYANNVPCVISSVYNCNITMPNRTEYSYIHDFCKIDSEGLYSSVQFRFNHTLGNGSFIGGAGGGGSGGGNGAEYGSGGGGGELKYLNQIQVNTNTLYNFYIGDGGRGAFNSTGSLAETGGSSTAFGVVANGGEGGQTRGGDGGVDGSGTGYFGNGARGSNSRGYNGNNSNNPLWGGGGASGINTNGGRPGGAQGTNRDYDWRGRDGTNGGGGSGGAASSDGASRGGTGGPGGITLYL